MVYEKKPGKRPNSSWGANLSGGEDEGPISLAWANFFGQESILFIHAATGFFFVRETAETPVGVEAPEI
jgi:hypothetical protein